jgi:hypothetical protein
MKVPMEDNSEHIEQYTLMLSRSRARRVLENRLITPGEYAGAHAARVMDILTDELENDLRADFHKLKKAETRKLLLAGWASAAESADRHVRSESAGVKESPTSVTYAGQEKLSMLYRQLIEFSVRTGSNGTRTPDHDGISLLLNTMLDIDELRRLRSFAATENLSVCVYVADHWEIILKCGNAPRFRFFDFMRERQSAFAYDLAWTKEPKAVELAHRYATAAPLPPEFSDLDRAMLPAFGCTFGCLLLTLMTLVKIAHGEYTEGRKIAMTTQESLLDVLVAEVSRDRPTSLTEIASALQLVTMSVATSSGTKFDPELARDRRFRPGSRPVVALGRTRIGDSKHKDVLAWTYPAARDALEDWAMSIVRSIWPWGLNEEIPPEKRLDDELMRLRNTIPWGRAPALERWVANELDTVDGFRVRVNLKESKRDKSGNLLPRNGLRLHNEIDVLAADERSGVLWVISVKDPYLSLSGRRLRNIRSEFFEKPKLHQTKLMTMAEDISAQKPEAAQCCGATARAEWVVRGAFVTRDLCPAAFDIRLNPDITFLRLSEVASKLRYERSGDA